MTRRTLSAFAALTIFLAGGASEARAAPGNSAFDAVNATGTCAPLEITIDTGYSAIVRPDIQIPRATTLLEAGGSQALASPADPGDSVDALAGLGIPEAEGYIVNGYPGAPSPFAGQGLNNITTQFPAPVNQAGPTLIKNPLNPALTYPYEHAEATYPNPQAPGQQSQTLAGTPNLSLTDPSGAFALDTNLAKAVAGDTIAIADAGLGPESSAQSPGITTFAVPSLGISVGRLSAHSLSQVDASSVTQNTICELDSVDIAPHGAKPLHIGSVVVKVSSSRNVNSSSAAAAQSIEFSGVTVAGQGATINQNGLSAGGQQIPFTLPPQNQSLPGIFGPSSVAVQGTTIQKSQKNADEAGVAVVGATIVITTTAPLPNAIPPSGVGTTPVRITIKLASAGTSTYGLPAQDSRFGSGAFSGGSAYGSAHGGGSGNGQPGKPPSLTAVIFDSPARAWIIGGASLLELLLIIAVTRAYLRRRRRVLPVRETFDIP